MSLELRKYTQARRRKAEQGWNILQSNVSPMQL